MGILSAFVGEVLAVLAYVVLFVGVYKLYEIAKVLGEIKELLYKRTSSIPTPAGPPSMDGLRESDDAAEYAAKLLRAVNAESQHGVTPHPPAPEAR